LVSTRPNAFTCWRWPRRLIPFVPPATGADGAQRTTRCAPYWRAVGTGTRFRPVAILYALLVSGFDPRQISFGKKTYFEHFKDLCRSGSLCRIQAQRVYRYGPLWALPQVTARMATAPSSLAQRQRHVGPTAALSSMPYVPVESLACLNEMYNKFGKQLWARSVSTMPLTSSATGFRTMFWALTRVHRTYDRKLPHRAVLEGVHESA